MFSKWGYLSRNLLPAKLSKSRSCCLCLWGNYLLLRQNDSALTCFPVQGDVLKSGGFWKNHSGITGQQNGTWNPVSVIVNWHALVEVLGTETEPGWWDVWGKIFREVLTHSLVVHPNLNWESSLSAAAQSRQCNLAHMRLSLKSIEIHGKFPIGLWITFQSFWQC